MTFLAAAAPLLGDIGAGLGAVGTVAGGIAQGNAADYQAQVAQNNAITAKQNAEYAIAAGEQSAQQQSQKGAAQIGEIKVAQAASGININKGSAVDVQAGQRETNVTDTENVLQKALLENYGYRTQAQSDEAQAQLDEATAEQAPIAGLLGAAGTLAGRASSLSSKWGSGTPLDITGG